MIRTKKNSKDVSEDIVEIKQDPQEEFSMDEILSMKRLNTLDEQEDKGFLYMHGATQFGQLGVGFTNEKEIKVPQKVDLFVKLTKIECGAGHSVAVSA